MYIPAHFAADDAVVRDLLVNHGAGELITATADGLVATLLPFMYVPPGPGAELGALHGHLARNNEQWRKPVLGEALAIVRGPDAYISPGWYAAKAEHGRVVPTWNYLTAHVYGRLIVHDDPAWLEDLVRRLTAKHETAKHETAKHKTAQQNETAEGDPVWAVDDAPRAFVEGQLRAIVGVELQITRIEAKAKLSQNRPVTDIEGVISGLTRQGEHRSAAAVRDANSDRPGDVEGARR